MKLVPTFILHPIQKLLKYLGLLLGIYSFTVSDQRVADINFFPRQITATSRYSSFPLNWCRDDRLRTGKH